MENESVGDVAISYIGLKAIFRCLSIFDKLGYYPIISNNSRILYKSIRGGNYDLFG